MMDRNNELLKSAIITGPGSSWYIKGEKDWNDGG